MSSSSNVTIDDLVIDHLALYETIRKSFTRDPFDHYVNGMCGLFFCLLGTISNAFSFSILIRRTMRLSTYVYLAGLSLSDFTACLFLIPSYIIDAYPVEVPDFELPRSYAYTQILIVSGVISTTARALSVWLCVAFTIDRWIMICRPFVGPQYCTMKTARLVTLIIYILSVFYAVPLLFEHESHEEISLSEILLVNHNKKIYHQRLSPLGQNAVFRWIYALINAIGVYIIPLSIIIVLNRNLLISIRLLEQRSAEYKAPSPTKQGVTAMLLATTIMLIVCRAPSAAISVMWLISAKMFVNEKHPFPLRKFHMIANLCATMNAATTFIMFIIYGTKFRAEFMRIYCCLIRRIRKKKTSDLKQMPEQEHHQMSERPRNDGRQRKSSTPQPLSIPTNAVHQLLPTDQHPDDTDKAASAQDTSVTTSHTATSISLLLPTKHANHQRKKGDVSSSGGSSSTTHHTSSCSQCRLIIGEPPIPHEHNDTKSVSLNGPYYAWFRNLIRCH